MVPPAIAEVAARAQRELSGRVLAVTLRSVRDLDIAEEATADAFLLALQTWPERGVPESVEAWLITAAKRRAIDRIRTAQAARRAVIRTAGGLRAAGDAADISTEVGVIGDEDLRLVVLCCDPRISVEDQIALTLRLACGVSTAAIAAAFLLPAATLAARITRAKKKLAAAGPALDLPDDATVDARLPVVRRVIHLSFTLGHTAASGAELTDDDLADRAQYLATALHALRPADAEFTGLLALILLTRGRAGGRLDDHGRQVLLGDADRGRWNPVLIERGLELVRAALARPRPGPMSVQAAIAAEHAKAPTLETTDWARVVELYGSLLEIEPSATLAIGRSVALGHLMGPAQGLADLDEVLSLGGLERYPYAFGARAYLLARLGRSAEARREWERAAGLARTSAERDYFAARATPPTVAVATAAEEDGRESNVAQSRSRIMITARGVAVPDDMAEVLHADPSALAAFEGLRPDDQRVYVDWVTKSAGQEQRSERLSELAEHVQRYQRRPAEEHGSPHPLLDV